MTLAFKSQYHGVQKSEEGFEITPENYKDLIPKIILKHYEKINPQSPVFLSQDILKAIAYNQKRKDLHFKKLFSISQFYNFDIVYYKNEEFSSPMLYAHNKIIHDDLYSCDLEDFIKVFREHAGASAHEKIDILDLLPERKDIENIFNNFIVEKINLFLRE